MFGVSFKGNFWKKFNTYECWIPETPPVPPTQSVRPRECFIMSIKEPCHAKQVSFYFTIRGDHTQRPWGTWIPRNRFKGSIRVKVVLQLILGMQFPQILRSSRILALEGHYGGSFCWHCWRHCCLQCIFLLSDSLLVCYTVHWGYRTHPGSVVEGFLLCVSTYPKYNLFYLFFSLLCICDG